MHSLSRTRISQCLLRRQRRWEGVLHLLVAFVERVRQRVLNVLLAVLLGLGGLELDGHLVLY